jgi:hypothetical protein
VLLRTQTVSIEVGGKTEPSGPVRRDRGARPARGDEQGGQKLFTSIEISPNFAGTNKAYLVGWPSPTARPCTETSPLPRRATSPRCAAQALVPVAEEFQLELADDTPIRPSACWRRSRPSSTGWPPARPAAGARQPAPAAAARPGPGPDTAAALPAMGRSMTEIAGSVQAFAQASAERSAFSAAGPRSRPLEQTPAMAFAQRQPATGGDGRIRTDC